MKVVFESRVTKEVELDEAEFEEVVNHTRQKYRNANAWAREEQVGKALEKKFTALFPKYGKDNDVELCSVYLQKGVGEIDVVWEL